VCQHEAVADNDARALAERHLARDLPQRWLHVQGVAAETTRLCAALDLDGAAVIAAAWLHDLGYAPALLDSGFHPLDAARYLREHGWQEQVCCLVAHHSDAALQADRLGLGEQLRAEFRDIDGTARDVLWSADATTGPAGQRMSLEERVAEISERYGPDNFVTQCMTATRPALQAAIARVATRLAARAR
jgi:hypothetical protein